MIIKKISLKNIRSYEFQELNFSSGSTLLWGDIGSGKSSVLLAIEFALFGLQPGQKGSSILRNGTDEGEVIMEFEVEGKLVQIERSLKRSKTITQDSCFISIDGEKRDISVTELKTLVLNLLNYPKEFSKKQNSLYKFTVYTPQEEMKQIILEDPSLRLNTLRHVFGIDKYKKILENISLVATKLREEKRLKEGMVFNLDQDKKSLEQHILELEKKKQSLSILEDTLRNKIAKRIEAESLGKEIKEKIEQKERFKQEVEKSKLLISTKKQNISDSLMNISRLKRELEEYSKLSFKEEDILDLEKQLPLILAEKKILNERLLNLSSEIHSLKNRIADNTLTLSKISKIEICPTCLQDVNYVHKSNLMNKFESDSSNNLSRIKELEIEKISQSKKLSDIENSVSSINSKIQDLKLVKVKIKTLEEKQQHILSLEKQSSLFEKDILLLEEQIQTLQSSIFDLSKYDGIYEMKQREIIEAQRSEKLAEISLAEAKKEINFSNQQILELNRRIAKCEEIKVYLFYINQIEDWLSKKFSGIIANIEKNVMMKLRSDFLDFFSKWFSMLVSESFNIRLSDDFSPIIEQQDYELDYAYLSGGERTAIALAYRLALNQVINSFLSKINTKDLVILDEPTDGFSEQQLDKMKDIFAQLSVGQLIIVSHEQKIEDFVEKVIKFRKEGGISRVY